MNNAADALFFTPNPCIERTLRVADFARGVSHRVHCGDLRVTAGGKGINAARVARNFGARVRVLAPVGRGQIAQFRALLAHDELSADLVEVAPDTRTATNIVHDGGYTELVEAGDALSSDEGDELIRRFGAHLQTCVIAVIGGSYPPAALPSARGDDWQNHAAMLCATAASAGVRVLYDGKGVEFERALNSPHPPWAIKPNLAEASELLQRDLSAPDAQRGAVAELMGRGVEVVLLSCGARGLWLGNAGQIEWLAAPAINEVSPVGSGDSLVGAFVATWLQSGDIDQAARRGVAAGSANAAQLSAARVGPQDAEHLMKRLDNNDPAKDIFRQDEQDEFGGLTCRRKPFYFLCFDLIIKNLIPSEPILFILFILSKNVPYFVAAFASLSPNSSVICPTCSPCNSLRRA